MGETGELDSPPVKPLVAAEGAVLEQAPALGAVERGPADVVDHAERDAADDRRIGQVVDGVVGPVTPHPPAVAPVGVAAVAGAAVQRDEGGGLDLELERRAVGVGQVDGGAGRDAGARPVVDVDLEASRAARRGRRARPGWRR